MYNQLSNEELGVVRDRGTEMPFSGAYDNFYEPGTYICRRCNTPLFSSKSKFDAKCGWPSFDANYPNAIKRLPDPSWNRTEIQCSHCNAHLGHVFEGENFTKNNTRHCVNSLSIRFVSINKKLPLVLNND